ncbi:QacE family quaternary ammonium compound efflux SMR transporter [Gammaproteobacteria bacterium 45_16_T64]|nr:QacE family quaternary ammonium compound efflux SMR transporter [Gammaproteobacteria bacterium 45_16_T64]
MAYVYLVLAIITEVAATSAIKASEEFTKPIPSAIVILGYGLSLYLLALVLRSMPVGVTYAVWAGLGVVLVTAAGAVFYKQIPDVPAMLGMSLIVAGVVVINLFSVTTEH